MSRSVRRALAVLALLASIAIALPIAAVAATHEVAARSRPYVFAPDRLTVRVGDTVTWTMAPGDPHTVTSGTYNASGVHADGIFDSGFLNEGEKFSFMFTAPGVYPYVCAIHADSGMVGRITVEAAPTATPTPSPKPPTAAGTGGDGPTGSAVAAGAGTPLDDAEAGWNGPLAIAILVGLAFAAGLAARLGGRYAKRRARD